MAAAATNSMEQQQEQQHVYTSEDLRRDVNRFRAEGDPFQKIYDCRSDQSDAEFMIFDTQLDRFIDAYLLPPLKEKLVKSVDSMNERIVSLQRFLSGPKSAKNDYRSATTRFFRRRDGINAAARDVDACMMELWRQRTCWRNELDYFVYHIKQINKKVPLFWECNSIKETLTLEEYDRKYITPFVERHPPLRRDHVFRLLERIYMARLSWRPKGFYFERDDKKGRECFAGNENAECVLLLRNYMRQQDGDWLQADVVRAEQLQLINKEAASEDIDEEYKRSRKEAFLAREYDSDEYGVYDDDEEWME